MARTEHSYNSPDWKLDGNEGTDHTENFVGTTDAEPVVLGTDNTKRMGLADTFAASVLATDPDFLQEGLDTNYLYYGHNVYGAAFAMWQYGMGSRAYGWEGIAAGGTPAAPAMPNDDALMGATNGSNWTGTALNKVCRMRYRNVANQHGGMTDGNMPTRIEWSTTRPGESSTDFAVVITERQQVAFGSIADMQTGPNLANSTVDVGGSFGAAIREAEAPITLTEDDHTVVITAVTDPNLPSVQLPAPIERRIHNIKNGSASQAVVFGHVDGQANNYIVIPAGESRTVHASATTWWVI